jgi:hypothetical protein
MATSQGKVNIRVWRWILWFALLLLADLVFYILLTPVWLGLRLVARWSDRRSPVPSMDHRDGR